MSIDANLYQTALNTKIQVNLNDPIYDKCWEELVVKVCVQVYFSKACAQLYLVGVKVAETCVGWERNGNRLTAKIDFVTVNVGIWKLESPTVKFEHDLDTNSGKVLFSGKLFKLEGLPPDYKLKKEWTDHTIGSW